MLTRTVRFQWSHWLRNRRACLTKRLQTSPRRRRRTLRRRGLLTRRQAATACRRVITLQMYSFSGTFDEFLSEATAGERSLNHDLHRSNAHEPAQQGHRPSYVYCTSGTSTIFSMIANCGIGLSSPRRAPRRTHDLRNREITSLSTCCSCAITGMSTTLSKNRKSRPRTTCTTGTATTLSTYCNCGTASTSTRRLQPGRRRRRPHLRLLPQTDVTVDLAKSLLYKARSRRGPGKTARRQSTRRTKSPAPVDTGLDPGSACPHRALWTRWTSLAPGVFTQDREIRTDAAARRWRGRVT